MNTQSRQNSQSMPTFAELAKVDALLRHMLEQNLISQSYKRTIEAVLKHAKIHLADVSINIKEM